MAKRRVTPGGNLPVMRLMNYDFTAWEPTHGKKKPRSGEVEVKQLSKKELAKRRAAIRRDAKKRGVKVSFGEAV